MMSKAETKPKKQYLVSVDLLPADVNTDRLLAYLRTHLTAKCGYGTRQANRILVVSDRVNKVSIVSPISQARPLEEHLISLRDRLKLKTLLGGLKRTQYEGGISLSIGVIYSNSLTCSILIPPDLIDFLSSTGLPVELVCYPNSDE